MINIDVYIPESKLLIIKWAGPYSIEEYINAINDFINRPNSQEVYCVLHDISNLEFNFKFADIKNVVAIKKKYINIKHSTVYITDKPQDVVFAQVFADEFADSKIYHCSTIERAILLLELENNFNEIKEAYDNLKF